MTDTKWTSGPWTARRSSAPSDGEYDYGIGANVGGREQCIAETFGRVSETERPNADANEVFEQAKAVRAKARGEDQ